MLVLHAILSGEFEAAVRWDWASVNVVRVARRPEVPPPHPDPPTPSQAAALVTAAWEQDVAWGTLVWLVMTTGMRRGEVLALRWRHVHFERQLLEIHRNYVQRQGRKIEKDTKTHQMRRISLDKDQCHRAATLKKCLELEGRPLPCAASLDPSHGNLSPESPTVFRRG